MALSPQRARAASPWSPQPGHGYFKIWSKWLAGFGYHDGQGNTRSYGPYHELFVAGYGEVGVAPGLAAWAHSDLGRFFLLGNPRTGRNRAHAAPGDPALGLRYQFLHQAGIAAAVELGARAPLANRQPVQTVYATSEGQPAVGALRVGFGAWEIPFALSAGWSWRGGYAAASAGYRVRTNAYDDALTWSAETGSELGDRGRGRLRLTGVHNIRNGTAPRHQSPSGLGNGTSYVGVALEAEYAFSPGWYLGGTFEGGLAGIRRQTGGPVLSFYVATQF